MRVKFLLIIYVMKVTADNLQDPLVFSGEDTEDSTEHIGASITQVYQHPYAASLLMNYSYICSAVVLNKYWVLTLTKCFNNIQTDILSSYVTHTNLQNYSIRAGSSYNNKGGTIYKIKMLINNFGLHVSTAKLENRIEFSSQLQGLRLPNSENELSLGFLASIIAWTPSNHMRLVNAPVIEPSICERNTKMLSGQFICLGGVQDPKRHFCRRDNGGAVIQNGTLIGISSFINTCAFYSKTHAFPKAAAFSHWLDSIIWDEDSRPITTELPTVSTMTTKPESNATAESSTPYFVADPKIYMLTLPFDPINVPLEPAEDNSVLPRMSLYEAYLRSMFNNRRGNSSESTAAAKETTLLPQSFMRSIQMNKKRPIKYNIAYN